MKRAQTSLFGLSTFLGLFFTPFGLSPAFAQNEQDCANAEQLARLALDDFPGMHGKLLMEISDEGGLRELSKPAPGYKSCQLFVQHSLRADSPTLICDLMKSFDVAPLKGVQTQGIMQNWRGTLDSVASDLGKCLGVKPVKRIPSKIKDGYEAERWYLFADRPQQSRFADVVFILMLDQPKDGIAFDRSHQVKAQLWVERRDNKKMIDTLSKQPPKNPKLIDFFQFAGLRFGDGVADMKNTYGEPLNVNVDKEGATHVYNYGDKKGGIYVATNSTSGKVQYVYLRSEDAPFWLRRRGVDDIKINLLGLHRSDVTARLGLPKSVNDEELHWDTIVDGKAVFLSMRCTDEDHGRCTRMTVGWVH